MPTGASTSSNKDHEAASFDAAVFDSAASHRFEKIDRLVERLHRYPLEAIALAMAAYLEEMLSFLLREGPCAANEIRDYLRDFESRIFEPGASPAETESVPP